MHEARRLPTIRRVGDLPRSGDWAMTVLATSWPDAVVGSVAVAALGLVVAVPVWQLGGIAKTFLASKRDKQAGP
jgi:hypothetical protein